MNGGKDGKIRVLLAKLGIDDHSKTLYVLANAFRNAGIEVIMLGTHQSVDSVINTAVQEDADVIGLSFHSSSHLGWCMEITDALKERGIKDIKVIAGGIIPEEDRPLLEKMGVTGNFGSGTKLDDIVEHIYNVCSA